MAKQMAFYFDASACIGCKTCELACKDKNDLPIGVRFRRVFEYGGGSWGQQDGFFVPNRVFTYFVSSSCMHCENPACVNVCPSGAMYKREDDGLVLVDSDKCLGCRYCEWACPYGAPQFHEEKGCMTKCDGCADLLAKGEKPACVASCLQRSLDFGDLEELRAKYGDLDAIEPLPDSSLTGPAFVVTPHRYSEVSGKGTGRIRNTSEV